MTKYILEASIIVKIKMWREGQVVWAKLKWYPWWPAKVEGIEECSQKVRVIFFEDNTYRDVNKSTLIEYQAGAKFKNTKRKDLLKAISEAEEYIKYDRGIDFENSSHHEAFKSTHSSSKINFDSIKNLKDSSDYLKKSSNREVLRQPKRRIKDKRENNSSINKSRSSQIMNSRLLKKYSCNRSNNLVSNKGKVCSPGRNKDKDTAVDKLKRKIFNKRLSNKSRDISNENLSTLLVSSSITHENNKSDLMQTATILCKNTINQNGEMIEQVKSQKENCENLAGKEKLGESKSDSNILKPILPIDHCSKKKEQHKYTYSEPEHEAYTKNSLINEVSSLNGVQVAHDSKYDISCEVYREQDLPQCAQSKSKNSSLKEENQNSLLNKSEMSCLSEENKKSQDNEEDEKRIRRSKRLYLKSKAKILNDLCSDEISESESESSRSNEKVKESKTKRESSLQKKSGKKA